MWWDFEGVCKERLYVCDGTLKVVCKERLGTFVMGLSRCKERLYVCAVTLKGVCKERLGTFMMGL